MISVSINVWYHLFGGFLVSFAAKVQLFLLLLVAIIKKLLMLDYRLLSLSHMRVRIMLSLVMMPCGVRVRVLLFSFNSPWLMNGWALSNNPLAVWSP